MYFSGYLPKKYYVYIVKCADGTYYTGKTNDLPRRLLQHNGELINGAKYTRTRRPVELVFYEECLSNRYACQREWEIKQMSHREKESLIYCHNQNINSSWLKRSPKL
jgi:putative endonuclease